MRVKAVALAEMAEANLAALRRAGADLTEAVIDVRVIAGDQQLTSRTTLQQIERRNL